MSLLPCFFYFFRPWSGRAVVLPLLIDQARRHRSKSGILSNRKEVGETARSYLFLGQTQSAFALGQLVF